MFVQKKRKYTEARQNHNSSTNSDRKYKQKNATLTDTIDSVTGEAPVSLDANVVSKGSRDDIGYKYFSNSKSTRHQVNSSTKNKITQRKDKRTVFDMTSALIDDAREVRKRHRKRHRKIPNSIKPGGGSAPVHRNRIKEDQFHSSVHVATAINNETNIDEGNKHANVSPNFPSIQTTVSSVDFSLNLASNDKNILKVDGGSTSVRGRKSLKQEISKSTKVSRVDTNLTMRMDKMILEEVNLKVGNSRPENNSLIRRINIFDFDGTLFMSPVPNPDLWDSGFIGRLLNPGLIGEGWFQERRTLELGIDAETNKWQGWWNESVVDKVRISMKKTSSLTVLLTGRQHSTFQDIIKKMIQAKGLVFDMICLKPDQNHLDWDLIYQLPSAPSEVQGMLTEIPRSNTFTFKKSVIDGTLGHHPAVESVHIWEDRFSHVKKFRSYLGVLLEQGIISDGIVHFIRGQERYLDIRHETWLVQSMKGETL